MRDKWLGAKDLDGRGTTIIFAWSDWGKSQQYSVVIAGASADIRIFVPPEYESRTLPTKSTRSVGSETKRMFC